MHTWLLTPPILFIVMAAITGSSFLMAARFRERRARRDDGSVKPYACGEEVQGSAIQPDYSTFFPFAFYFTILHVVALMISTVPTDLTATIVIAVLYIVGAVIGMFILLEKQS